MVIRFDYAEQGFEVCGEEITNFELAGTNGGYVPAKAKVQGNTIVLSSETVPAPVSARYMWIDYAEVTLFGKNGLPVAPFHTNL